MEESLKRLKQARKGATTAATTGANGGPTDDGKIRLQLALDVEYLGEQVCSAVREHKRMNKNALTACWNTEDSYAALSRLSQIQKMGLQPGDISMFSTLMDLVKEARELAEQNQWERDSVVTRTVSIYILHSLLHFQKTDEITKNKDSVASPVQGYGLLWHYDGQVRKNAGGKNGHYLKPSVFDADFRAVLHKHCCS